MKNTAPSKDRKRFLFSISPATWLTVAYLFTSILWILLSDDLAFKLSNGNSDLLRNLQRQKGIFFVGLSGIVIYLISNTFYAQLKKSFQKYEGLESTYRALNEATREGIFDCDLETLTATLNKKMQFFLPGNVATVDDFWVTYKKRIAPNDVERLFKEFEETIASKRSSWQTEYRILGEDNLYYTVISSIYIVRDEHTNKAKRLIGAIQDVSDLRNLQAEYYNEQINHKQKLATSIIEAQETEKNRWAEELHDNVCQLLSVAKLNLSAIDMMPEESDTLIKETKKLVTESIEEIRHLSATIKPPTFDDNLLTEALATLTEDIKRVKEISFVIDSEGLDEMKISDAHRILIYRVVQEQLTNIMKYAESKHVKIMLSEKQGQVFISVVDDGKGFNTEMPKSGIGLRNIQSRLQLYKGKMKIVSSPGNGCELKATFSTKNI